MSQPITTCRIVRAAKDIAMFNDKARATNLRNVIKKNLDFGSMTIFPCPHNPGCRCSDREMLDLLMEVPELATILTKP